MIIPSIRSLGSYTKVIVGKPECLVLESLLLCGKLFTHAEFPSILVLHVIVPSHAFSLLYGRVLIRMWRLFVLRILPFSLLNFAYAVADNPYAIVNSSYHFAFLFVA